MHSSLQNRLGMGTGALLIGGGVNCLAVRCETAVQIVLQIDLGIAAEMCEPEEGDK